MTRSFQNFIRLSLCLIVTCALLASCGGSAGGDTDNRELDGLIMAGFKAGHSWGDLKLNQVTLTDFVNRNGTGLMTPIYTPEHILIESSFRGGQLTFLFVLRDSCERKTRSIPPEQFVTLLAGRLEQWFQMYPECSYALLESISVVAAQSPEYTFFHGTTDKGVRLFDKVSGLYLTYGADTEPPQGIYLAAQSQSPKNFVHYKGIFFFFQIPSEHIIRMTIYPYQDKIDVKKFDR